MFVLQNAPRRGAAAAGPARCARCSSRQRHGQVRPDAGARPRRPRASRAASSTTPTSSTRPPSRACLAHLRTPAARRAVANPERPLSELPLLAEAERQQLLVEWNDTARGLPARRAPSTRSSRPRSRARPTPSPLAFEGTRRSPTPARRARQPARPPPARAGRRPRLPSPSAWSARWSWSSPCWPSSRPAAPTSRWTPPTPPSAWPSCSRTRGAPLLLTQRRARRPRCPPARLPACCCSTRRSCLARRAQHRAPRVARPPPQPRLRHLHLGLHRPAQGRRASPHRGVAPPRPGRSTSPTSAPASRRAAARPHLLRRLHLRSCWGRLLHGGTLVVFASARPRAAGAGAVAPERSTPSPPSSSPPASSPRWWRTQPRGPARACASCSPAATSLARPRVRARAGRSGGIRSSTRYGPTESTIFATCTA